MKHYCTLLFLAALFLKPQKSLAYCNDFETLMYENFETEEIIGANCNVLYSCGRSRHSNTYALEGRYFGWFNLRDGLVDEDVYDRIIDGFCPNAQVEVGFVARKSYGITYVTFMLVDEMGNTI